MKNSCSSLSTVLEKYFDQEVTDEEKLLVESHLQECPGCRDELNSMEELRSLMRVPVEEATQKEDFPWAWQKIERGIRQQEKPTWRQSLRSWLDVTPLFKKRVWIPAVATVAVLLFLTTQIILKKTPSYPEVSVVEYVESQSDNVMVYQLEEPKVTVIWLFEGPEEERTPT